jgi:hypothetical protein
MTNYLEVIEEHVNHFEYGEIHFLRCWAVGPRGRKRSADNPADGKIRNDWEKYVWRVFYRAGEFGQEGEPFIVDANSDEERILFAYMKRHKIPLKDPGAVLSLPVLCRAIKAGVILK